MPMVARSPLWDDARLVHLRREPECRACGTKDSLEVHHVEPVHVRPERELDPTNLITFCRRCHLFVGHLGLWASWNRDVRFDAGYWRKRIQERP